MRSRVCSSRAARQALTASSRRWRLLEAPAAALARAKGQKGTAEIALGHRPLARHALRGKLLKAIGAARLLEPPGPALALAKNRQDTAEIVLGHRPVERHTLAGVFLKGGAIGGDRLLEPRGVAL